MKPAGWITANEAATLDQHDGMPRVLTIDDIHEFSRYLGLWRVWTALPTDLAACSRTAVAELYRYNDPGHPAHGTWSFQLIDRRWTAENVGRGQVQWLEHPDALEEFPTWGACFDAAFAAVTAMRGAA